MTTISKGESPPAAPIPSELIETLDSWRHFIVVGHVRPDADCLGSMYAVALTWPRADGSPAKVSLPAGSLSRRLAFMADWADVRVCSPEDFAKADGFVAVDTAKKSRCNVDKLLGETWADGRTLINIDHHTSNTDFGRINWIDAHAGSASELVYRLIRAAGREITPLVASLLYSGIHADTVGFSLPTTAASALTAAADLVACGARVGEIGELLCRSQDRDEFELYRVIYENTKVVADGRVAYSTASFDEITGAGCTLADIDDQVGIPRSIRGIKIAVLLTEGKKGKTRINLRGESGINVLDLARELGGGGHAQAAGAILNGSIEEAVNQVIPKAIERLDEHANS
jgi:phosphoesterase RecJ-like protein